MLFSRPGHCIFHRSLETSNLKAICYRITLLCHVKMERKWSATAADIMANRRKRIIYNFTVLCRMQPFPH